jgi:hypothetical protein
VGADVAPTRADTVRAMPTLIVFCATEQHGPLQLVVDESPDQVHDAHAAADGAPLRLTRSHDGERVFVNPRAIAYWLERSVRPRPRRGS